MTEFLFQFNSSAEAYTAMSWIMAPLPPTSTHTVMPTVLKCKVAGRYPTIWCLNILTPERLSIEDTSAALYEYRQRPGFVRHTDTRRELRFA